MRILLIEDDHKIATALRKGLESQAFDVDIEYDAESGLSAALSQKHNLIVVDGALRGVMDGAEICRAVRAEKIHTPMLLLTAKDGVRDRIKGLDAGADEYVAKPFAFEELMSHIRALLQRPEDLQTKLSYDDLVLDVKAYEVRREGRLISLSRREFALLEFMLRNAGRLLPKDTIIKHVWHLDADVLPNTVEVYMGYLRNKIDKPFKGVPLITTVRGYGYRLGSPER